MSAEFDNDSDDFPSDSEEEDEESYSEEDEFDDFMAAIGDDEDAIAARDSEDDNFLIDGVGFAEPGGRSALRRATKRNPRNLPCPECGEKNRLTPLDVAHSYICNACADAKEGF